jgi:TolA-binding protein
MSQSDNFIGGFLLGTLVGGVAGGVLGAVLATKIANQDEASEESTFSKLDDSKRTKGKRRKLKAASGQNIEVARRGLEDKIAQLNNAIDEVRQQLGSDNGTINLESDEEAIAPDA